MKSVPATALIILLVFPAFCQLTPKPVLPRQISGQVRLDDRVAPQGVLVMLDLAPSAMVAVTGSGTAGQTVTNSGGKFFFGSLEQVGMQQGREYFAVTARYPGYRDAVQVVDLNTTPSGYTILEMHRDTSRDIPNIPPGGPGETISVHQPSSSEARDAMVRGKQYLLQKHDAKTSITEFKKVVKLDPQFSAAYFLLGTAHMQLQEFAEAEAAFEKVTKLEPGNAAAFLGIGASLNQRGDFRNAQKVLLRSLLLEPNSAEAQYEYGRSLFAQGQWQDAEPHVRKSLELNPGFAMSHVLMGNIDLRKRQADSALREFREYLRLDPEGSAAPAVRDTVAKIENAMAHQ